MSKRKVGPPKTLHCSRCSFVTHSGIKGIGAHCRKAHPRIMKAKATRTHKRCPHCGR